MPNKIFEMKMRMNKMILKDLPDVPFVFKGGTSLLFKYDDFPRLSQDIDIALDKEKWEENIELIIQTLKAKGYTVDEDEKEGYATSFNISYDEGETILDISKYKGLNAKLKSFDSLEIEKRVIKVFPTYMTFIEKAIAIEKINLIWNINKDSDLPLNIESIRKFRHLYDLGYLWTKIKDEDKDIKALDFYLRFIKLNEGNTTSTKDIDTMLNLEIFKNINKHEEVSDFKNIYDQWGKEEFIENEKPSFDEVINSIKEIVSYWGDKNAD